eukprot:SAG11_NODE_78_length_17939_cov_10.236883_14_plen_60_part_00
MLFFLLLNVWQKTYGESDLGTAVAFTQWCPPAGDFFGCFQPTPKNVDVLNLLGTAYLPA